MLLQSYDFVELARRYGCNMQMGGSDQWGNIVMGIDLGRRMGTEQLYALTCPLLTTASGAKMGKTASGRRLAQRRPAVRLRLLAILAQHRGRRRRPLPEALHDAAARRDRKAGSPWRCRNQRSKKDPRHRGNGAARTADDAAEKAAETAHQTFEQGTAAEGLPTVTVARRNSKPGSACLPPSSRPGSPHRTEKPGARSRAARCASTMRSSPTTRDGHRSTRSRPRASSSYRWARSVTSC